jgi:RND family efflux transporter MFP subunit
MEISLGLPESVITRVREGMAVGVEISAIPGLTFTGRVTEVAPSADANTSTYPVRVVVENESDAIRSGMAARVVFELGGEAVSSDALVVPASAVGEDGDGRFVFLVRGSPGEVGTVEKRRISIGRMTGEGFEVLQGLTAEDKVATAGLQNLLDGQAVRLGAG